MNIGELFVSLGFDVDEEKLKNFNKDIREGVDGLVKISVAAGGAVTALNVFIGAQADSAIRLRNLNAELGLTPSLVQGIAAAMHQANPAESIDQATESIARFSSVVKQQIAAGGGPSGALAQLLGNAWHPGMSEEEMLPAIAANKQRLITEWGGGAYGKARFADLLGQVGLGGQNTRFFDLSQHQMQAAIDTYSTTKKVNENLEHFAEAQANLTNAMNKFSFDLAGELSPTLTNAVNAFAAALLKLDTFNQSHPGAGTHELAAAAGVTGVVARIFGASVASKLPLIGGAASGLGGAGILAGMASIPWLAGDIGEYIGEQLRGPRPNSANKAESMKFWMSQGYTQAQAAGLVANEEAESSFNPTKVGDGGRAVGSFQWHPDRAAAILKSTGIDVRSASHIDQLRAAAWEMVSSGVAGKLMQTKSARDSGALVSRLFERPRGGDEEASRRGEMAANITQNIYTNAPLDVTLSEVNRANQASLNAAYSTTNLGPNH